MPHLLCENLEENLEMCPCSFLLELDFLLFEGWRPEGVKGIMNFSVMIKAKYAYVKKLKGQCNGGTRIFIKGI